MNTLEHGGHHDHTSGKPNGYIVLMPSPINHSASRPKSWLQNFVSCSLYLDMARTPTRFSDEITTEALIGDGIIIFLLLLAGLVYSSSFFKPAGKVVLGGVAKSIGKEYYPRYREQEQIH
ncbi:MAG: hypothetical protein Q8Q18_00855 [bacterium]|nr:hypothetical protein [bacterium]